MYMRNMLGDQDALGNKTDSSENSSTSDSTSQYVLCIQSSRLW